jgi:uncharacterized protein (TIGR03437 family)
MNTMRFVSAWFCLMFIGFGGSAQVFTTSSLTGKYFARHIQFTTDAGNNVTDSRSIIGTMTFDGAGNYSFNGQQTVGTTSANTYSASGTYTVTSAGFVTLTNPQNKGFNLNARYGVEGVIGSSTEATGNVFDLFIAIPAPAVAPNNSSVTSGWSGTDFELTGASTAQVRNSFLALGFDGAGNIGSLSITGHAANFNSGHTAYQSATGGTYAVNPDGSGTILFPAPAGVSGTGLLVGQQLRTLYLSKTGNVMLAGTPGAHDLFVAVKNSAAAVVPFSGERFWTAGIRVDSTGSSFSYAGSAAIALADGSLLNSRRLHETGSTPLNVTEAFTYTLASDGTGSAGPSQIALEQGNVVVGSSNGGALDPTGYEIQVAIPMPQVSGSGVFINPQGVFNAASNAPAGDAVSPGEFLAIFGSGFVGSTAVAPSEPFPLSLSGVTVAINGLPAPIYFVAPGQIDCIVPYKVTGAMANITVTSNGVVSNMVSVPLAATSPGIFTLDGSGTSDGSITHADGSLVNAANPAKKGETVVMYVSGLGALTTPVNDGAGATSLNNATATMTIYVAGVPVPATGVLYHGLTSLAGLYQINFVVPATLTFTGELPVAILTPDAFTDLVNIAVQ